MKIPLKHLDNAENPIPSPISELCVCELFKLNFCQIYSSQISVYYVQAYAYLGEKNTCMKLLYGLADYSFTRLSFASIQITFSRSSFAFNKSKCSGSFVITYIYYSVVYT